MLGNGILNLEWECADLEWNTLHGERNSRLASSGSARLFCRAVAPTPAGPAMAGPVFASGTKILKTKVMHYKRTFSLGGTKGNTLF